MFKPDDTLHTGNIFAVWKLLTGIPDANGTNGGVCIESDGAWRAVDNHTDHPTICERLGTYPYQIVSKKRTLKVSQWLALIITGCR